MAGTRANINVDFDKINSVLIHDLSESKQQIDDLLEQMRTKARGLKDCWSDSAGQEFIVKCDDFIDKSKEINGQIDEMISFINLSVTTYSDVEKEYVGYLDAIE